MAEERGVTAAAARRDDGFALIEVVVAIAILAGVIVWSFNAVVSVNKAEVRIDRDRTADGVLKDLIEGSAASGCGMAADPADQDIPTMTAVCGGQSADRTVTVTKDGTTFTGSFVSYWVAAPPEPTTCNGVASAGAQPERLRRVATVSWERAPGDRQESRSEFSEEAIPADQVAFMRTAKAGVVIPLSSGQTATLDDGSGGTITRHADLHGCAWFPFLTPGRIYTFRVGGSTLSVNSPGLAVNEQRLIVP